MSMQPKMTRDAIRYCMEGLGTHKRDWQRKALEEGLKLRYFWNRLPPEVEETLEDLVETGARFAELQEEMIRKLEQTGALKSYARRQSRD